MPRGIHESNRLQADAPGEQPTEAPAISARATETRRERRRRDDGDLDRGARMKLAIPKNIREQAEREGKTLRWVNDEGNRMHDMTVDDDWDVVQGVKEVPVKTDEAGKPVYARLCAKPLDWWQDDQRAKARVLDEREKAVARGAKADPEDKRQDEVSYVVPGNRISRGA